MKTLHILAGLLALCAGMIALFAPKGYATHRISGRIFVASMLAMSGSGVVMALAVRPNPVNVVAGSLTFYLVCTAWLTVKRSVSDSRPVLRAAMIAAFGLGAFALMLAGLALRSPDGGIGGVPAAPIVMFALVGLLGGALDARLLRAGAISGPHRLARHLWRMSFALWIATMSFFLGQARLFPDAVRDSGLLFVPVAVVAIALAFWLLRVWWYRPSARPLSRTRRTADPSPSVREP